MISDDYIRMIVNRDEIVGFASFIKSDGKELLPGEVLELRDGDEYKMILRLKYREIMK